MKSSRVFAVGLVLGLVLSMVLVAGNLLASAEGDGTSIHACVGRWGRIRIVPKADCCRRYEKHLEWNIQGPRGERGLTGEHEWYTSESDPQEVNPGSESFPAFAMCEVGDQVTGGGYNIEANNPGCVAVIWNMADGSDQWSVQVMNDCDTGISFLAQAVCVKTAQD